MWETRVWWLGQEDPLEKEMATHSSTLAWKIPWTEEPGRLWSTGSQRVGHDWVTSLTMSLLQVKKQTEFSKLKTLLCLSLHQEFIFVHRIRKSSDFFLDLQLTQHMPSPGTLAKGMWVCLQVLYSVPRLCISVPLWTGSFIRAWYTKQQVFFKGVLHILSPLHF